jgi:hypothetical protein
MPYFTIIGRYTPEYGWVKFAVLTLFVPFNDIQKAAKLVFFFWEGCPRLAKVWEIESQRSQVWPRNTVDLSWSVYVSV